MLRLREEGESLLIVLSIVLCFGLLYRVVSRDVLLVSAVVGAGAAVVALLPMALSRRGGHLSRAGLAALLAVFLLPLLYAATRLEWSVLTPFSALLLAGLAFLFFHYAPLLPLALLHLSNRDPEPLEPPYPSVTVVVPAYNEEGCVGACIDALNRTDYPAEKREVVVVDDGSTDGTYDEALRHADDSTAVLRKPNGGKWDALNHGLAHSTGEVVVTVDADSLLEPDALKRIAAAFQRDDRVGAVAGDLTIANRGSLLTELQELEYVVGIQLMRRAYDALGTVLVVPGAIGAYRRDVLERVGGFDGDTLTEDMDATVKVLKDGCVTRTDDALCHTEAPETWRDLYKQRLRWFRGSVQTLLKHRDVFTTPEYGYLYSLAFPVHALTAFVVPLVGIAVLLSIAGELLYGSPRHLATLFGFFALLQTLTSALALRIGGRDPKLALLSPLFVLGYRQFLDGVMLKSVADVLTGREVGWTGPSRTGRLRSALENVSPDALEPPAEPVADPVERPTVTAGGAPED